MAHQNLPSNARLSGIFNDDVLQAFCRQPPTNNFGHGSAETVLLKPNAAWEVVQGGALRATRAMLLNEIH